MNVVYKTLPFPMAKLVQNRQKTKKVFNKFQYVGEFL